MNRSHKMRRHIDSSVIQFIRFFLLILTTLNSSGVGAELSNSVQIDVDAKKVPMEHVEGVLGHRVELPCDISSRREDSVYMVLWFRENAGKPLYTFDVRGRGMKTAKTGSSKAGFDRRADFQSAYPAHLLVSDLKEGDQAVYRCRVDFKNSRSRNALVNLTVVVPPSPPIIYDASETVVSSVLGPYVEGSDVLLKCRVKGGKPEPVVSWYVNGALEDATYYVNAFGDVINELLFQKVNRSHLNSQFTCKTANTRLIQPVEKTVTLDLSLKPLFVRLRQKNLDRIVAGKEYRVTCETAGSKPPAILRWIKGGKEIALVSTQDNDGGNVTTGTFVFVPTPEDNGASIICRAENPLLNKTHILEEIWHLNVVYPPEVKLSLGSTLNPMEIKEGTDVYFECKIQANPKISRLTWIFNGEELKHNVGAGIIMSNQSLVLQGINRKANAGNFTCVCSNSEGSTSSNAVHLSVMYTPVCLSENGVTVGASKGESVGLRCAVEANPTAFRFEWEFHGASDNVDVVPVGRTVSHGDLSRFFYTPNTDSEYGTFLCWGSNSIGRQVQPCVFHVVAAVKPHPLENCSVVNQTMTLIHVVCNSQRELPSIPDQPLFRIMNGDGDGEPHHPDPAEYGLFPEYYVMEVWDQKNRSIRRNLSAEAPVFILKGLAPGSWLKLILYAANSHGKSESVAIETLVAGDAEKHTLGERRSQMEFFPVVALGVSAACVGTLLLFVVALSLRSRLCGHPPQSTPILRANGNGMTSSGPHPEKNSHPGSLMTPTTTTHTSDLTGYRSIPQSKSEADAANPDIIPGANSFSTDYEERNQWTMGRKGIGVFLSNSGAAPTTAAAAPVPLPGDPYQSHLHHGLPSPNLPSAVSFGSTTLERRRGDVPYPNVHYNHSHHPPHQKMDYGREGGGFGSGDFGQMGIPVPSDYNTIYIRDKLFHDADIPESCV